MVALRRRALLRAHRLARLLGGGGGREDAEASRAFRRHFNEHHAGRRASEGVEAGRVELGDEEQESAGLRDAVHELGPPLVREDLLAADRRRARGKNEERVPVGGRSRDVVQRKPLAETVGETERVLSARDGIQRREFADEIAERDVAVFALGARDSQRDARAGCARGARR